MFIPYEILVILFLTIAQINGKGKGFNFMASTLTQDSITLVRNQMPEYFFNASVELFHPGTPEAYFNINIEILKELPSSVMLILKAEKFNDENKIFEPTPLSIVKNYCSYMRLDKIIYPIILKKGNFPKKCPVPPGHYHITNFTVTPADIPASVPLGVYKLSFAYRYEGKFVEVVWTGRSI